MRQLRMLVVLGLHASMACGLRVGVGTAVRPPLHESLRAAATDRACAASATGVCDPLLASPASRAGRRLVLARSARAAACRAHTREGALCAQMQKQDQTGVGRRQMVSVSAAAAAAVLLRGPAAAAPPGQDVQPAEEAAKAAELAWRKFVGKDGKAAWLGFREAEGTYPLRFIEYLARFLLNFDEGSRELFVSQAEELSVLPRNKRQEARFEQFARFSTSVEFGLRRYSGADGAIKLAKVLVARYGRDNRDALQQIGFLFALMEENQPVQEISRVLARLENATVDSIVIKDGGSGYTGDVPQVLIEDPNVPHGPQVKAEAVCTLRETGQLLTVRIKNPGLGYLKPPEVVFTGLFPNASRATLSQLNNASVDARQLIQVLDAEALDIDIRPPKAEAIVREGKVVAVKIKDRGSGLSSGDGLRSLRVEFLAAEDSVPPVALAEGYAVLDRKVAAVNVTRTGSRYSSTRPPTVTVEPPGDCGGERVLGRPAAVAVNMRRREQNLTKVKFMSAEPAVADNDINMFIQLYPRSVSIVFQNESQRFVFSEKSLLGYNVTTSFGPISQYSRRSPTSKEVNLDKSVYWRLAAAGAICASIGHGLLVPLDTVKTRLQTAPPGKYENTMDAFVKVLRDEGGGAALLRGLQPEVVGFAVYGAFSFGGTEFCRRWVADLAGPQGSILYQIPILMLGSAMASVVAIAATCPFMAIKTRLIADESFAGGDMIKGFRRVINEEEWQASLFGGLLPLMLKDVLFVLSKFVVFDIVKTALFLSFPEARDSLSASLAVSLVSGSFAGMVSAVTSQPGDYLFSKSAQTKEASLGSAWATYWDDGVKKGKWADLLTGLPARIVFSGALIAIQFVIYDYLRVQFHVSPNELLEFLDVMATVPTTAT